MSEESSSNLRGECARMFEDIYIQVAHNEIVGPKIRALARLREETAGETISELRGNVLDWRGFLLPEISKNIAGYASAMEQFEKSLRDFLRSRSPDYAHLEEIAARQLSSAEDEERELKKNESGERGDEGADGP
ncbi:hypothetical protein SSOG_04197 [Streptomyces himastatinicus ATCC 53653]|uniref:Uncharacterized protein n=2 Tax=Streptomyces violaceusniger group TaxID=2839105 RepID=D9WVX4_9ACTN|nr:hypothetical protein SSOG_04197 [Streptomyces himastatinicus ATCC 53653]